MLALRHGRLLFVIGWLLIIAIFVGSLEPVPVQIGVRNGDKVLHFLAYFGVMYWFSGLYRPHRRPLLAFAFFLMGAMIEILQGTMTVTREADVGDLLVNTVGICCALALTPLGLADWAQRLESWLARVRQ